jgi:hypothetical protein
MVSPPSTHGTTSTTEEDENHVQGSHGKEQVKPPPIEKCVPRIRTMSRNILKIYETTINEHRINGSIWYELSHLWAIEHSGTATRGAGVIAAFAPNTSWDENKRIALRAFRTGIASGHTKRNCHKAQVILDGADPTTVLSGKKVRNFYALIANPFDPLAVCVDRHAFDVAVGKVTDDSARKFLDRVGGYDLIANAFREASLTVGILPSQIQAITWLAWRRNKRRLDSTFTAF